MTTKLKEGIKTDEVKVIKDENAKITLQIKEYSDSNQNIVKTVGEIDAKLKELTDLRAQYVNLALSNNGALAALKKLIDKPEEKKES
jgi:succinate dehydrogenase/fumarate reductase flavoprotein subunit